MAGLTRKEAREEVFKLLFETEFRTEEERAEIFASSRENREVEYNDYVRDVYFGVCEHLSELDEAIVRHSKGWKPSRITPVSRSVIRLCLYEMMFREDIPHSVSLNEAVELIKKYEDAKLRTFVNGLLNSAKNEIEGKNEG